MINICFRPRWLFTNSTPNEGISILENWAKMGLPFPPKLLATLNEIKEEESGNQAERQK